jgi:hypothetical protein
MKYAVYSHEIGWLVDTCAFGTWSWKVVECVEFDSEWDAKLACEAADIEIDGLVFVRVR